MRMTIGFKIGEMWYNLGRYPPPSLSVGGWAVANTPTHSTAGSNAKSKKKTGQYFCLGLFCPVLQGFISLALPVFAEGERLIAFLLFFFLFFGWC